MDRKLLKELAQTEERMNEILSLRKEAKNDTSKYDEIFYKYGQEIYNEVVPEKYRKKDINKLLKQGRLFDIYLKHGEYAYEDNIHKMRQIDIYNETGSEMRGMLYRLGHTIKHKIAPLIVSLSIAPTWFGVKLYEEARNEETENAIKYANEIEDYNKKIVSYAEEINAMKLSDIQIFMKVMSDMWEEIDGYSKDITINPAGYFRITLNEEKRGVCRHMADDVTAKLNKINPKYNARNVYVYVNSDGGYEFANIPIKVLESDETIFKKEKGEKGAEEEKEEKSDFEDGISIKFDIAKITGNHVVTAVDVPSKKMTLILDPTNPGIGVFTKGGIYMFNASEEKEFKTREIGQVIFAGGESFLELSKTELESFLISDSEVEKIREEYGIDAQNEAIEYIKGLEDTETVKVGFVPKVSVNEKSAIKKVEAASEKNDNIDIEK